MENEILYTVPEKGYKIRWSNQQQRMTCTCPDFQYRGSKDPKGVCKHIVAGIKEGVIKLPQKQELKYRPRAEFDKVASHIDNMLDSFQHLICGSYRRKATFIKDLDIVVLAINAKDLFDLRQVIQANGEILYGGEKRITAKIMGEQVDFRICSEEQLWGAMILHFTGPKEANINLRKSATMQGMILSEYGLRRVSDQSIVASKTEEEIYRALGLRFYAPHER
jgi:DNA polymerase/3'-5' exonuclease PolX